MTRALHPDRTSAACLLELTRAQMRVFRELRDDEMIPSDDVSRRTAKALEDAGLAYSLGGWLRISDTGKAASVLVHNQLLLPRRPRVRARPAALEDGYVCRREG